MLIDVIVLCFFGLLIRLPLALDFSGDQHGVYSQILMHAKRKWIHYHLDDSVQEGMFPYPMLLFFLVSFFPKKYWRLLSMFLALSADLAVGVALYFYLQSALKSLSPELMASSIKNYSFGGSLLFLTLPLLFPLTSRLRASNGRAFGLYFSLPALFMTYEFAHTPSVMSFSLAALAIYFCLLGSFFASQTIFFFFILMALLKLNPLFLLPMAAVVGIGYLAPILQIRDLVIFKIAHFIWYEKTYKESGAGIVGKRNLFKDFFLLPYYLLKNRPRLIESVTHTSIITIVFTSLPWAFIFAPLFIQHSQVFTDLLALKEVSFFYWMILCSLICFFITSVGVAKIFGQSERYFEYSSPFFVAVFVFFCVKTNIAAENLFLLSLAQVAIIVAIHVLGSTTRFQNLLNFGHIRPQEKEVVHFLQEQNQEIRTLVHPVRNSLLFSGISSEQKENRIKYYYRFLIDGKRPSIKDLDLFYQEVGPNMTYQEPLKYFKSKYGINTFIVKNTALKSDKSNIVYTVKNQAELLFQNKEYSVYKI